MPKRSALGFTLNEYQYSLVAKSPRSHPYGFQLFFPGNDESLSQYLYGSRCENQITNTSESRSADVPSSNVNGNKQDSSRPSHDCLCRRDEKTLIIKIEWQRRKLLKPSTTAIPDHRKSVQLIQKVIELFSPHGEKALDSFRGILTAEIAATATSRDCVVIEKDESRFNEAVHHLFKCVASKTTFVSSQEHGSNFENTVLDCMERQSVRSVSGTLKMDRDATYDFIPDNNAAPDGNHKPTNEASASVLNLADDV